MSDEPEYGMSEMREAAGAYDRLRRAGKPIPEDVRKKRNAYQKARRRSRDPETGTRRCGQRPRHDIPEKIRGLNRRYEECRRAGLPVPEHVAAGQREYKRLLRRAHGIGPLKPLRTDIPDRTRKSASSYHRLHRRGEDIPEEIMAGTRLYVRLCGIEGRKTGRLPLREDIPDDLRAANTEYHRLLRNGLPIPGELRAKVREYARAAQRGRRPAEEAR